MGAKSEIKIMLDYLAKKDIDFTEDSIIPEEFGRDQHKSENILMRLTPKEKMLIERFANKHDKTITQVMMNAVFLQITLNAYGARTALDVIKAVRFMRTIKKYGGSTGMNGIIREDELNFEGDDGLNDWLWI